jgi:hypothetical protein
LVKPAKSIGWTLSIGTGHGIASEYISAEISVEDVLEEEARSFSRSPLALTTFRE